MHEIVSFEKEINFKNMINSITSISLEHTLSTSDKSNIKGDFIISGTYKMTAASQIENDFSYKIPVDIEIDKKYDLSNLIIDIDDFTYEVLSENILKVNIDLLLDKMELKKEESIEFLEDEIITSEDLFMEENTKEKLEFERNHFNIADDEIDSKKIELLESEEIINEIDKSVDFELNKDNKKEEIDNNKKQESDEDINAKKIIKRKEETTLQEKNDDKESPSLFASFDSNQETYSTYSVYILRENDSIDEIINKYKITREMLEEYNDLNDLKIGMKIIIPNTKDE